jgi:PST family polysaccharide transporter
MNGAAEAARAAADARVPGESSYRQILKSSAWIGGSSALTLAFGLVRTKAFAILLGPAGIGLLGLYTSIFDLTRGIAGMGINSSGVRQIAQAVASNEPQRLAVTVTVLRRVSIVLALAGAALLVLLSHRLSVLTFGTAAYAGAVSLVALALLFQVVADGRAALIQGMRRIGDLARMAVLGAAFGTVVSIPTVYVLGEEGVVFTLVAVAGMAMASAWWYSRKIQISLPQLHLSEVKHELTGLFKLGLAFMASALMMMGAAYVVRLLVVNELGMTAAGFYQAAWTLGGLYVGFILNAMGADFYPRLVGAASDDLEGNRLVNEQALVSMLMAGPGVLATLTFAPIVVHLLYSAQFGGAVDLLRWICLGMALRIVTWPMGYMIIAKGRQTLFFFTELAWTVVSVGLAWQWMRWFGLEGTGGAFFGSYVFHALLIYPIVRRLSGFRWSAVNLKTASGFALLIAMVFAGFRFLQPPWATALGVAATVASGLYSMRALHVLVRAGGAPRRVQELLGRLGAGR